MNCPTCLSPLHCERCLRSERTKAGLDRAAKQGRKGGPKRKHSAKLPDIFRLREKGMSFAEIARLIGVSKSTAHRLAGEENDR